MALAALGQQLTDMYGSWGMCLYTHAMCPLSGAFYYKDETTSAFAFLRGEMAEQ